MSGTMIIFKATGKVLLNFLPATVFVVVGLAYLAYKEKTFQQQLKRSVNKNIFD